MKSEYKRILINIGWLVTLLFWNVAKAQQAYDLTGVAGNMLESVVVMSDFVQTACFVIGGAFLFTSIIKYIEHKRSPLMVPISTVVFLVVAGIVLILLPFLTYFVDNGVSYSLMK